MKWVGLLKGFDWDQGNLTKNWKKHRVSFLECEDVFFNEPLVVVQDEVHSRVEPRYCVLGRTDQGRLLFVVFTVRKDLVRVISARDMSRKERESYDAAFKKDPEI
ncbi:MAG: BrnT family toxin [Chlamydiae bacterium]|nr:BrnT family toxin [Chlamydiota bacterium]